MEFKGILDTILDTVKQEVDYCRETEELNEDYVLKREEAIYIYNMISEIIKMYQHEIALLAQKEHLTLTEAIVHIENQSLNQELCESCRAEHAQLASWLSELREFRRKYINETFSSAT